ncbi:hypothetical protein FAVG1_13126 [Fusarium avenaceum]|nr:hypothetical protein FAVG1_13126 [Fusarium avenaceum]
MTSLDPAQAAFNTAIHEFKAGLNDQALYSKILTTTIKDVYEQAIHIQQEQPRQRSLINLARASLYLERLRDLVAVIDAFVQVTPDIAPLIWGPVNLLLRWTSDMKSPFDELLHVLEEIGILLPDFNYSAKLFPGGQYINQVLALLFQDILDFYLVFLKFFSSRGWKIFFGLLWPRKRAEIDRVIGRMRDHTHHLRNDVHQENIQEAYQARRRDIEDFDILEKTNRGQEYDAIQKSIAPADYWDRFNLISSRTCEGTGDWLIEGPDISQWLRMAQDSQKTIWLYGIPGAGKTCLTACVVRASLSLGQTIFVFLSHEQDISALSVFHSLVFQLARENQTFQDMVRCSFREHLEFDLSSLVKLFTALVRVAGPVRIIIDGLDKIDKVEGSRFLDQILKVSSDSEEARVLISSRPEAYIKALIENKKSSKSICVDTQNTPSINAFVKSQYGDWLQDRNLSPEDETEVWELLSDAVSQAKGSFIYAHRVIAGLQFAQSVAELRSELNVLATNLDASHGSIFSPCTDSGYVSASAIKFDGLRKPGYQTNIGAARVPDEHNVNDTTTEYSNSSSAVFSMREEYIVALSDDLFRGIGSSYVNEEAQTEISTILPELLQAFALKVGHNAPTPMHRDVMVFVYKNRREIATAFTKISSKQCEEDLEVSKLNSDSMSLQERMSLWEKNEEIEMVSVEEDLEGHSLEDTSFQHENEEAESSNRLLAYREFIPSTEAYEWLLTRLRREFCLIPTELNTIRAIRTRVMSLLSLDYRTSRKVSSQSYSVRYELDWHILGFFESQGYSNRPDQVLENVVTLTGSCQDAQAATCDQYVRQTWPLTGEMMVQLLKEVLQGMEGQSHLCELPDGTTITALINGSVLAVEVSGVAISIAEAGEQLAWIGAALRTSTRQTGIVYCTPMITNILQNDVTPSHQFGRKKSSADITCEIAFKMEEVPHPLSTATGQCWHDIFKNPVIVRGYPIPRRPQWRTGLEIPLNIMAGLVQTQRVDQFDNKIYIKGFAMMLVPSQRIEDILHWHLVYNKDGSRISYLDDNLDQEKYITRLNLEDFRHVLGWCSEVKFYAGSNLADRTRVGHSGLPKPHAGCALVNKFVSAGRIISNGPSFDLGTKDKPFQVSRGGYIPLLQWMATKFVLLWDESDKRGWIINGTSALLHIVRASLAHDKNGDFSSAFLFERLEESHKPDKANSAIHVLINRRNLNLKLCHEHDGHILLGSRIEYFCNILEKLIDHQAKLVRDCDGKWSDKPRKYLEGWDFEDLARKRDPLYPRVATLEAGGKAWVDFTRSIQAITLFGRGFGDIIRPSVVDFCRHWAKLPTKQYYVAVCLSDLREVIKEHGSHADGLARLGDDLIWHTSTTIFGTCQCKEDAFDQDHCEPVQSIFPSALSETLGPRTHVYDENDENDGALIFGHNSNFPWVWGDVSHPQEGALQEATSSSRLGDADANSFHDSGIGSTVSEGRTSASGVRWMKSLSDPCEDNTMLGSVVPIDRYSRTNYTVGIICALSKELKAVRALFDKIHQKIDPEPGDSNTYALGQMAQHMVVAACLPFGEYGTNSAAVVASNMVRSFPLKFCLLVGIGGGVPSQENDIRLGDVVVGLSRGEGSSVIQYDLGKENISSLFKRTGTLQGPPRFLTTTINVHLLSDPNLRDDPLSPYLDKISACMSEYGHPGKELDVRQQRDPRPTMEPRIHYGQIASGNRVVKNAAFRDRVASENGAICFEMEAAGVVNTIPSLVIRGICDYCDAQKNDCWQEYAAATAAAYSKLLLSVVARVEDISLEDLRSPSRLAVGFKRQRL